MNAIVYRLTLIHGRLDQAIRLEVKRRFPDSWRLLRLTKLKLVVKQGLHRHQPS